MCAALKPSESSARWLTTRKTPLRLSTLFRAKAAGLSELVLFLPEEARLLLRPERALRAAERPRLSGRLAGGLTDPLLNSLLDLPVKILLEVLVELLIKLLLTLPVKLLLEAGLALLLTGREPAWWP